MEGGAPGNTGMGYGGSPGGSVKTADLRPFSCGGGIFPGQYCVQGNHCGYGGGGGAF